MYYSYGYDPGIAFFVGILYLIIGVVVCCIWGWAVNKIISNKGYSENWFWWGFFFGLIALIVALTKPECHYTSYSSYSTTAEQNAERLNHGGWKCSCGRINPSYTGTCACGITKYSIENAKKTAVQKPQPLNDAQKIEALKGLKELLDSGAITQEEYDQKKKIFL